MAVTKNVEQPQMLGGRFDMDRWEPGAMLSVRRAMAEGETGRDRRRLLGWLNGDRDRRRSLVGMLYEEWQAETGGEGETGRGGRIIEFFKWIIENPEKVAAFIKLIQSLFGGATTMFMAFIFSLLFASVSYACPPAVALAGSCGAEVIPSEQVYAQAVQTQYVPQVRQVVSYQPVVQNQVDYVPVQQQVIVPQVTVRQAYAYSVPAPVQAFAVVRAPKIYAPARLAVPVAPRGQVFSPRVVAPLRNLFKGRRAEAQGLPSRALIQ